MDDRILAVIIGGGIAIMGSVVTQLMLFLLNSRKEREDRRRTAIQYAAQVELKSIQANPNSDDRSPTEILEDVIAEVGSYSDDEISALIGLAQYYVEHEVPITDEEE